MGVDLVSVDEIATPEEIKKLSERVKDLEWLVNVLRARSRKDAERKRVLREKNERLQERINVYESYRKRYLLQVHENPRTVQLKYAETGKEKALAELREEAEELRQKDESQQELMKEFEEALAFRLEEVANLTLSAKMMSNHIQQLEAGLVASTLLEMEEAEEPRRSHRRTRSLPPQQEDFFSGEEEAAEKRAQVRAVIQNPVELEPQEEDEEYQKWANAQIMRLHQGAIRVNRLVKDLRGGSAEAVRLRALGIA